MIRVGFSYHTGWRQVFSDLIMWVTGKHYSHVWLLLEGVDGIRGRRVVLESTSEGLRYINFERFAANNQIVLLKTPPFSLESGYDWACDNLGVSYDTAGLVGEGWVVPLRRFFLKKVKNPLANANSMWCSELVARVIMKSKGYEQYADFDYKTTSPDQVEDMLDLRPV